MKPSASFPTAAAQSGLYATPTDIAEVKLTAQAAGFAWFDLDLAKADSKQALLARCQQVFDLPPSFGENWDALADSLEDLSWHSARGYVVAVRNGGTLADRAPDDLAVALEILANAATYWSTHDKAFIVMIDGSTRGARAFGALPR
jgi:hypothetical protein